MKLTTPDVALRPNSVPCGPRSTSTRSRSKNSPSNRRVVTSGMSLTWIAVAASQVVPVHRSPMPRIVKLDVVKLVLVKVTLGSDCCSASGLTICCLARLSAVKALTAIGTSCNRCDWRCAVTTMSPWVKPVSPRPAPRPPSSVR